MDMESMLLERSGGLSLGDGERPASFKIIGICLAIGSGLFIGVSFVLKKVGLLRANEKYHEEAGEGYGYLKNAYWWGGMTLMILGEVCNMVAYAFTDAILVTPLGALAVVVTTVLSAIFLKERLSMVGKVSCFLCIVGSVVIVMNAPHSSAVNDIQEMQKYAITPGFLSYTGVIVLGCTFTAFWAGPRYGKKNMLVYITICSWIGGLSVVSIQGLGAAIIAWIKGAPQYKEWFLWVLLVFVVTTLLVEIIYLNKALNLFNAALVTPTYYVYFTTTTIITSVVLFQGFKGTATQIVTMVLGFLTICSGVVLLQLSKAAKDVPDSAVFKGDLDQIQTIAEQEQPESEPKADAIRGTAALVRRFSSARLKMERDEMKRLHEEKTMMEQMRPISEDGQPLPPEYEWDGLRRRRTMRSNTVSSRHAPSTPTSSIPPVPAIPGSPGQRSPHPPLGMSRFPDANEEDHDESDRSTIFSSIAGTITGRHRSRTRSTLPTYNEEGYQSDKDSHLQHPVPLTDIKVPRPGTGHSEDPTPSPRKIRFYEQDTSYGGPASAGGPYHDDESNLKPPSPPPHATHRTLSFTRVFRRSHHPSEEESAGLVKGDRYARVKGSDEDDSNDDDSNDSDNNRRQRQYDPHQDKRTEGGGGGGRMFL